MPFVPFSVMGSMARLARLLYLELRMSLIHTSEPGLTIGLDVTYYSLVENYVTVKCWDLGLPETLDQ